MSDPPRRPSPRWYEEDGEARAKVRRSRKNEKRLATSVGGRGYSGSGNRRYSPHDKNTARGDVGSPDFHIEHKGTTNKKSITIKKEWLAKVEAGAKVKAKDPALAFTFESPDGRDQEDYMVLPMEVFQRLCRAAGIEL